ncbi:MAG: type II secretion system protein [Bacillota bacterium]
MQRRHAFTLVELLVVVAIIAILIAVLLPALRRAQESGKRVLCMNNHRQLIMAVRSYANDWKDVLPFVNSNNSEISGGWRGPGWLYWRSKMKDPNAWAEDDLKEGALWKYLRNLKIYRCPFEPSPTLPKSTNELTSYCMNAYVKNESTHVSYKHSQFKTTDILFWEADEYKAIWNDGCNYPDEGITARHGGGSGKAHDAQGRANPHAGAIIGCFGGHAEWVTVKEFEGEATPSRPKPTRLFCGPMWKN